MCKLIVDGIFIGNGSGISCNNICIFSFLRLTNLNLKSKFEDLSLFWNIHRFIVFKIYKFRTFPLQILIGLMIHKDLKVLIILLFYYKHSQQIFTYFETYKLLESS